MTAVADVRGTSGSVTSVKVRAPIPLIGDTPCPMFRAMGLRAEPGGVSEVGGRSSTCWTVIEAAAAGQTAAREEFAVRYLPVARAWFSSRWRGTPLSADIDDAVQEVFVDCFRDGGALGRAERDRPGGFRAYLFGILRNVALHVETRRARSKERPPERPSGMDAVPDSDESLGTAFDRAWALTLLQEAAGRCADAARSAGPEAERRQRILRMRFEEDLPVRDIAERLGMDAADTHREYARAREEFLEALLAVVGFHHPGDPGEVKREAGRLLGYFQ